MSQRSKKIFLLLTIVGSFMIYCAIYYAHIFKNAPYNFTEFKSFTYKYGDKDSMLNEYNSLTGAYQYLDAKDSLVKTHLFLTRTELLTLHEKAADLGFWDFPSNEMNNDTTNLDGKKPARFIIAFNYKRKSKKVTFDVDYQGPQKLVEANQLLIKAIEGVMSDAEERQKK
jgi:hypothetical protein